MSSPAMAKACQMGMSWQLVLFQQVMTFKHQFKRGTLPHCICLGTTGLGEHFQETMTQDLVSGESMVDLLKEAVF